MDICRQTGFQFMAIKSACFHRFLECSFSLNENIHDPTCMCHGAHSSLCNACYLICSWKGNPDLRQDPALCGQAVKISCLPAPKHHLLHAYNTHTWDMRLQSKMMCRCFTFTCHVYTFCLVIHFMSAVEPQLSVHLEIALNKWKWTRFLRRLDKGMSLSLSLSCILMCSGHHISLLQK